MRQTESLPPTSIQLLRRVFAGCRQSLLGDGPSRHYLCNPCMGAWTPTPWRSHGAFTRFFPSDIGLTLHLTRLAHQNYPCNATSTGGSFSRLQSFRYVQAPMLARPPGCTHRKAFRLWAAGPFTPRIARLVTCPEMWHRYTPESGNWRGGTLTRWIAALSAAPRCLDPYPAASLWCPCPLLPKGQRPHLTNNKFGTPNQSSQCNFYEGEFSGLQSFRYVQAPILARPPGCTYR